MQDTRRSRRWALSAGGGATLGLTALAACAPGAPGAPSGATDGGGAVQR